MAKLHHWFFIKDNRFMIAGKKVPSIFACGDIQLEGQRKTVPYMEAASILRDLKYDVPKEKFEKTRKNWEKYERMLRDDSLWREYEDLEGRRVEVSR